MSAATSRFEGVPELARYPKASLQRCDGALEVAFARRGAATAVARLYQRNPCRVHFPHGEADGAALAMLLNTAGGLTGGDRIAIGVTAEAAASATVTSAAAEKIYRSLGADCSVTIDLAVGDGAWLEWLPQETILFEGARLRRSVSARVAPTGRLLAAEMLVFGRVARGERWRTGALFERWRVECAEAPTWYDAMRLDGDMLDRAAGLGGAEALATAIYVAADAQRHLPLARETTAGASCHGGATLVNGMLVARFIGAAVPVRAGLVDYVAALRHAAAGLPAQAPRAWVV
jgi:urease accessory protein